jgi:uncharacterized protein (TIGR03067 family)
VRRGPSATLVSLRTLGEIAVNPTLLLFFALVSLAQLRPAASNEDTTRIQGAWKVVSASSSGKPTKDFVGSHLVFEGDNLQCRFTNLPKDYPKNAASIQSKFKLDPSTTPKSFDWIIKVKGEPQTLRNRVYSLEKNTLIICVDKSGRSRPTKLETVPADDRILYVLKRVEP